MERIDILMPFFEEPIRQFHIRELARILKKNPMTIKTQLRHLEKEKYVEKRKGHLYPVYVANTEEQKFLNIKLFYNLEKLRKSRIIDDIKEFYNLPVIILFGSFAKARDWQKSDIDICVITDSEKDFFPEKYEKLLNHPVEIHKFTEKRWKLLRKNHPELQQNILTGLTLSGAAEL